MSRMRALMMAAGGGRIPEDWFYYKESERVERDGEDNPKDWQVNHSLLPTGNTAKSISCWIKLGGEPPEGDRGFLVGWGDTPCEDTVFCFSCDDGGDRIYGDCWGDVRLGGLRNGGYWHHYALTYDGDTLRFYMDGLEIQSRSGYNAQTGSDHACFGSFWSEIATADYRKCRAYARCLTWKEVKALARENL